MTALTLTQVSDFLAAVRAGLCRPPRSLPCRFFYDDEGSLLFEQICDLPEYYLTRTEDRILRERADEIAAALPTGVDVVELGSGSSVKTRILLEALLRRQPSLRYVPVDISGEMLTRTARVLSRDYPRLTVDPVVSEYGEAMSRLREERQGPTLVLFLGSNLGNYDAGEALAFLSRMRAMMTAHDRALLGLDLRKDPAVLEAAYDDAAGVTARFNRNLLRRINRELGGDFDLDAFSHRAFYNPTAGRIEMHLVSRRAQTVTVAGHPYRFEAGETIHTENSYKYSLPQIRSLAAAAHFALARIWQDENNWFSVNFLEPEPGAWE